MSRRRIALLVVLSAAVVTAATLSAALQSKDTRVYKPNESITVPSVVKEVKPVYTPEALKKKIQGSVGLQIVVLTDGTVGDVEVTRSLDAEYGLDAEAAKAARQWVFKPGMKDGKPVAVQITLELTFTLKK